MNYGSFYLAEGENPDKKGNKKDFPGSQVCVDIKFLSGLETNSLSVILVFKCLEVNPLTPYQLT